MSIAGNQSFGSISKLDMERSFSVDDFVGGLWSRLGAAGAGSVQGFNRTDSEAAFQEFLKRIPSASNLAAAAQQLDPGASTRDIHAHLQQSVSSGGLGLPTASLSDLANASVHSNGMGGLPPMPRVPSLDFLRQLVNQQQGYAHAPAMPPLPSLPNIKLENGNHHRSVHNPSIIPATAALNMPPLPSSELDLASLHASGLPAALPPLPPPGPPLQGHHHHHTSHSSHQHSPLPGRGATEQQNSGSHHNHNSSHALSSAAAAAALNPAAAAAAALHLGQLGQLSRLSNAAAQQAVSSGPTQAQQTVSESSQEPTGKGEIRRARRMLSNRESARRSRRRKQEHLMTLEEQISALEDDKKALTDKLTTADKRLSVLEEEGKRMQEENARLRDELKFLRSELSERKDRNGFGRNREFGEGEAGEDQPISKRSKGDTPASRKAA